MTPVISPTQQPNKLYLGTTSIDRAYMGTVKVWEPSYDSIILAANPVSYWKSDETSGTTAADAKGLNPGTYTGGFTLAQPGPSIAIGNCAVAYNGADNSDLNIGNPVSLQLSQVTLAAWIKTADTGQYKGIMAKQYAWAIFGYNGYLGTYDWGAAVTTQRGWLADSAWHFIAMRVNSAVTNGSNLWLDGAQSGASFTYSVSSQGYPFAVAGANFAGQYIAGSIAKPVIFSRLLSDAELLSFYNRGR